MKNPIFALGIAGLLAGCAGSNTIQEQSFTVKPPIKGVDVQFERYVVSLNRDTTLVMPTGTEVYVPAGSIVDESGSPVDSAEISFREFHSIADIIVSGIPMVVKQGDSVIPFETAGMFEINASRNGKLLHIDKQKTLSVALASDDSTKFDSYLYDSTAHSVWNNLGNNVATQNLRRKRTIDSLQALVPVKPQLYNPITDLILDLSIKSDGVETVNGVLWKYAGKKSKQDLAAIMNKEWNKSEIIKQNGQFVLELTGSSIVHIELQPVYSAAKMEKAEQLYKEQMERAKDAAEELQIANRTSEMLRSFQVANFGIYNCDRLSSRTDLYTINPSLFTPDNKQIDGTVYIIEGTNSVIPCSSSCIRFDPNERCALIMILPDYRVAYLTSKEFKRLNILDKEKVNITMNVTTGSIVDANALNKLLSI